MLVSLAELSNGIKKFKFIYISGKSCLTFNHFI
jgi:hypothetical protein